ncbi:MAG: phosphate acyltransferase PlsX [candidate division Zixibacteria bacterium]|nr:phosphate acyltransferase PlsX [candidate division Zixibacteria bacterium]
MTDHTKQTVALDVMGADGGPEPIVRGGVDAARRLGDDGYVVLVGDEARITAILSQIDKCPSNLSVRHADTEITMHMAPTEGVRRRDSSMAVGLKLVHNGEAGAFLSAGNTGAVMATSLLTLGRIKGVSRPAIAGAFPTNNNRSCVVLDVGANADCKPKHLAQFAVMGSIYSQILFDIKSPRVGLISIGEERSKGNELIFSATRLLRKLSINFIGNIEGRDILGGDIDVAVTDGFTGNILLKFGESFKPFLVSRFAQQVRTNFFSRIGAALLVPFLRRIKNSFDYAHAGGAPLLGVNGVVIICHGASDQRAISNAVVLSHDMIRKRLKKRIEDELTTNHFGNGKESDDKSQNHRDGVVYSSNGDDQR